ncbi:MAG: hypothetical protein Q4E02_00805 [Lagierella massiliensis]|nr:hypothetical protein [Lagierella massiliensis]
MTKDKLIEIIKNYIKEDIDSILEKGNNEYEIVLKYGDPYSIKTFSKEDLKDYKDRIEKLKKIYNEGQKIAPNYIIGQIEEKNLYFILWRVGKKVMRKDYELGIQIGRFLKKYHEEFKSGTKKEWEMDFGHKIVLFFHNYYLCGYSGSKDYILLDYLTENKHLIIDRKPTFLLDMENVFDVYVDNENRLSNINPSVKNIADPYYQFKGLNLLDAEDKEYAKGLIKGYFEDKSPILFFKTIAIYTIVEYLFEDLKYFNKLSCEVFNEKIEYLLEKYGNFSDIYPDWYK